MASCGGLAQALGLLNSGSRPKGHGIHNGLARTLGLLSSGSGPKGHGTPNAPLFLRLEDYALLAEEKYCVSGPKYGELLIINAHMFQCVSDM